MFKIIVLVVYMCLSGVAFSELPKQTTSTQCDGTGLSDATVCIQHLVYAAESVGKVEIKPGIYLVSSSIKIPSKLIINAEGVTIIPKFKEPYLAVLELRNAKNVTINALSIFDEGKDLTVARPSKYNQRDQVIGFSNADYGILITGTANNIQILNCHFLGLENGIFVRNNYTMAKSVKNLNFRGNTFTNLGKTGIKVHYANNVLIEQNIIKNISGNFTVGSNPKLLDAKFADGIYLQGVRNAKINRNVISEVRRSGIVLEGNWDKLHNKPDVLNDNISIESNYISAFQNSRDSEDNGGIWVEGYKQSENLQIIKTKSVIIAYNQIDDFGAQIGSHAQYGIACGAESAIIHNNIITNVTASKRSFGIFCSVNCAVKSNYLMNNYWGVTINNGTDYITDYEKRTLMAKCKLEQNNQLINNFRNFICVN